jgi:hypothetical protein
VCKIVYQEGIALSIGPWSNMSGGKMMAGATQLAFPLLREITRVVTPVLVRAFQRWLQRRQ